MKTPDSKNAHTKESPLVSVAMCTYNGERFVREQLDSLIAQDYPNLEIIITDDRSTDSTFEILQEYQKKNPNIRAIQNQTNLGFVKNFEKAISLCSGEYIALCDQDDIWFPEKTSTLVSEIGNASLIYSSLSLIDENNKPVNKKALRGNRLEGMCNLGLLFRNCITGHVALIRKDVTGDALPIPPGIQYHDHWIAFVAASKNGIKALNKQLSLYRVHGENAAIKTAKAKDKNPITRRNKKKEKYLAKLEYRIRFIEYVIERKLLTKRDEETVRYILNQTQHLKRCFINWELRKFLNKNSATFLPAYSDQKKALKKLTRGNLFHALRLYS